MTEHTLYCTIDALSQTLTNIELCGGKDIQANLIDKSKYKITYHTEDENAERKGTK